MILYFSGTGNSRYAAVRLAERLGDKVFCINDSIKAGEKVEIHSETPLVFVTPTYAWRMPKVVEAWIKATEFQGCKKAYFLQSCGSSTQNSAGYSKKLCSEKGLEFMGFATLLMPENYVAMFPVTTDDEIPALMAEVGKEIEKAAEKIQRSRSLEAEAVGVFARLTSALITPVFYKCVVKAKAFRVTDLCVSCGKCEELCPLNNVKIKDGKPLWGESCTHCMACICACPTGAVEYGKGTVGKPRYYLKAPASAGGNE